MTNARYAQNMEIHDELRALRDQAKSTAVLEGFLVFLSVVLAAFLLFSFVAGLNLITPLRSAPVRWCALALLMLASTWTFVLRVLRPLLWRPTFDELARLAEEAMPGLDNACINAVQLGRFPPAASRPMVERALMECVKRSKRFDLLAAVDRRGFLRAAVAAGVAGLCLAAYAVLAPRNFTAGVLMLLDPARFVPAVGSAEISYVRPGDIEVLRGQIVRIEAGTAAALDLHLPSRVLIRPAGASAVARDLARLSPTQFAADLGPADTPYDYLVEIAGTQSAWYHVVVAEKPAVKSLSVLYEYPAYTRLGRKLIPDCDGRLAAPYGTKVTLYVESTRPLASARLDVSGERVDLLAAGDEYHREASFVPRADGMYRIFLTDVSGNAGDSSAPYAIKVIQDEPPKVSIPLPGRDATVASGSSLPIAVEASDDYGIAEMNLILVSPDGRSESVLRRWESVDSKTAAFGHNMYIDPKVYKSGLQYVLYATAVDANTLTGPLTARSARYVIKVVDYEEAKAALVARLEDALKRLKKVLADQEAAKGLAANVSAGKASAAETFPEIKTAQVAISEESSAISSSLTEDIPAFKEIRQVLDTLVAGDMADAVDICDRLFADVAAGSSVDPSALETTQDKIIEALKRLIGAVGGLIDDVRAGKVSEGNEIPSQVKDELRKLLDSLNKLVDDQKRIIEATNNLAAKPVRDYTDEDRERLKDLAAAEDDWSKFLKEEHSDLSKLPTQDFADPTMLKDIVETYSEIEMAADALSKKAVTIAVPREQVGLELAEELTTHIEKWLMDVPDRFKWELEEPLQDVNAPMAQLPTNLQDMVGDLMEREEDLFSDIEDVSSSWADSLDKGAGWDAMDGPISNMSAQGVTGNALPNSSEIAGRSGEGRTGKSSGEFVGDTSVGKGGRRTPTRITPDDFVAGQVEDKSKEPPGGATGGGKQSGAGQRGLQGLVPQQLSERISALAGRQAEIISSAQKVNVSLRLAGYPNAGLNAAVGAMQTTEESLRAGRLGNAIRQRPVLVRSFKNVTDVIGRRLVIRKDNALVLPKALQDEIIDGSQGSPPRGYDMLLKGYYESLSSSK